MIWGTSTILSKYGPVDLLIITEMLQKIQEYYGSILVKYYVCQSGTQQISNMFGQMYVLGTIFLFISHLCEILNTYFENMFCGDEDRKMINFHKIISKSLDMKRQHLSKT